MVLLTIIGLISIEGTAYNYFPLTVPGMGVLSLVSSLVLLKGRSYILYLKGSGLINAGREMGLFDAEMCPIR